MSMFCETHGADRIDLRPGDVRHAPLAVGLVRGFVDQRARCVRHGDGRAEMIAMNVIGLLAGRRLMDLADTTTLDEDTEDVTRVGAVFRALVEPPEVAPRLL